MKFNKVIFRYINMDPYLEIVSPKPIKNNTCSFYSIRKSNSKRLQIEKVSELPHPNSTKHLEKKNSNNQNDFLSFKQDYKANICNCVLNGKDNITLSTFSSLKEGDDTITKRDLNLNFFEECERDLTNQECQDEIFSILTEKSGHESFKQNTPISCQSAKLTKEDLEAENGIICNSNVNNIIRVSMPPSRPKNPFFTNFENKNGDEIQETLNQLQKCFSEDFQNIVN